MPTLPIANFVWPLFRVLVSETWGGEATSGNAWEIQPMKRRGPSQHGMYVKDYDRCALPMIGRARIAYRYGKFDDTFVGSSRTSSSAPWDPSVDTLNLPNLAGKEVRIQAANRPSAEGTAPTWTTVWLGYCEYQEDVGAPGASLPQGERVYHCVESIARCQRWQLDRHGYTDNSSVFADCVGHPGYNAGAKKSGRKLGDRNASQYTINGVNINYHTQPGAGSNWTDQQALEHALAVVRPPKEPLFTFSGTTALLSGENAWEIKDGETVLEFLSRVCRRERGRGCVFVDWTESDPTGPITVTLKVRPQHYSTITYTDPGTGASSSINGAQAEATALDVDLTGDHRLVAEAFQLGSPDQWKYDALETQGERIEVLATLAYQDGYDSAAGRGLAIERRWASGEQSTFEGLTAVRRVEERYRPVYQLHGLRRAWGGQAGDGNGGNSGRIDYRCNDNGVVMTPGPTDDRTSPLLVEILPDLPIFDGYTYQSTTPARYDGQTETGDPPRKPLMVLLRVSSEKFLFSEQTPKPVSAKVDSDGLWVYVPGDAGDGTRYISKTSVSSLSATYNLQQLAVTVGLRLPHRVRFQSYAEGKSATNAKRKAVIRQPDMHLWLAPKTAIWDLDTSTGSTSLGHTPRRSAALSSALGYGVLRDDRAGLAQIHALASTWYLQDRRTAIWALRDFGFLGDAVDVNGDPIATPTLGEVVHSMTANGTTYTINTPVVRMAWDNESGVTTWETGWSSLDFE